MERFLSRTNAFSLMDEAFFEDHFEKCPDAYRERFFGFLVGEAGVTQLLHFIAEMRGLQVTPLDPTWIAQVYEVRGALDAQALVDQYAALRPDVLMGGGAANFLPQAARVFPGLNQIRVSEAEAQALSPALIERLMTEMTPLIEEAVKKAVKAELKSAHDALNTRLEADADALPDRGLTGPDLAGHRLVHQHDHRQVQVVAAFGGAVVLVGIGHAAPRVDDQVAGAQMLLAEVVGGSTLRVFITRPAGTSHSSARSQP